MTHVPPPVLGFNNNVRHRGRVFHIQTEDSGVRSPRIVTHLFADGGRIIKTIRTEYSQHLERPDLSTVVRQLMKAQHKAMFAALRAGALDTLLESACGPLPPVSPESGTHSLSLSSSSALSASAPVQNPSEPVRMAAPDRTPAPLEAPSPASNPLPAPAAREASAPDGKPTSQTPSGKPGAESRKPRLGIAPFDRSERPTLSRPASRYGSAPSRSSHSIFGDGVISEKSLDEVILSYLAEELDGSSE